MNPIAISYLYESARRIGIALNKEQLALFSRYGDLLLERNRQFNLTAITDENDIAVKHFVDSLTPAVYVPELNIYLPAGRRATPQQFHTPYTPDAPSAPYTPNAPPPQSTPDAPYTPDALNTPPPPYTSPPQSTPSKPANNVLPAKLLDIGAGAGFPGLPLKILFGDALDVTLMDATLKKVNFMNEAIDALNLRGCRAVHIRAEEAARRAVISGDFALNQYNFTTARALAALPKALEYCLHFLAPGGLFIAMKGRRETAEAELAQSGRVLARYGVPMSGAAAPRIVDFALPAAESAPADSMMSDSGGVSALSPGAGDAGTLSPGAGGASAISPGTDGISVLSSDAGGAGTLSPGAGNGFENYRRSLVLITKS